MLSATTFVFMRNNGGRQEWFQVQRKLNETLDEIAAQATNVAVVNFMLVLRISIKMNRIFFSV